MGRIDEESLLGSNEWSSFFRDLNQELETMKQLLKEIVKRITDNLLGKSSQNSDTGRQNSLTHNESQSV